MHIACILADPKYDWLILASRFQTLNMQFRYGFQFYLKEEATTDPVVIGQFWTSFFRHIPFKIRLVLRKTRLCLTLDIEHFVISEDILRIFGI